MAIRYTLQLHADSRSWAPPDGRSVRFAASRRDALEIVRDWSDEVGRYDDPRDASALVWVGRVRDVTDQYPDGEITVGPRGGLRWGPC
jgi:hypothetical protein